MALKRNVPVTLNLEEKQNKTKGDAIIMISWLFYFDYYAGFLQINNVNIFVPMKLLTAERMKIDAFYFHQPRLHKQQYAMSIYENRYGNSNGYPRSERI